MGYKLASIQSSNFMKLPDDKYNLMGSVGFIKGRNSQGKSSLLHIVQYVMGEKVGVGISNPIRVEEDEAKIVAEFVNEAGEKYSLFIKFTRTETGFKTSVYVVTKEGAKISGAKRIREFLGDPPSAVDILQVAKNQSTKAGQLRNLKGLFEGIMELDIEESMDKLSSLKSAATDLSRDIKTVDGMFKTHGIDPAELTEETKMDDAGAIKAQYAAAREKHIIYTDAMSTVETAESKRSALEMQLNKAKADAKAHVDEFMVSAASAINGIDAEISRLKGLIEEQEEKRRKVTASMEDPQPTDHLKTAIEIAKRAIIDHLAAVSEAELTIAEGEPDVDGLDKQLNDVAEKNQRIALMNSLLGDAKRLVGLKASKSLNDAEQEKVLSGIKEAVNKASEAVDLPERFSFDVTEDGGVGIFYKDPDTGAVVPFNENQVAASQMMLGSLALTMAAHAAAGSPVSFITIKDASLLDKRSMLAAIEMAEAHGFSVYPEIVTEDDGVEIDLYDNYQSAKDAITL